MRLRYRLLNVFARQGKAFSGNPLCVFEDGRQLDEGQMQGLARQFNLSETTFLRDPAPDADVGVRIFTPSHEMAFAGHPTLGTAHVARALGFGQEQVRLSMPVGVIPVVASGDHWTLTANRGEVLDTYDAGELAPAVGLEPAEIGSPVQLVSTGSPQVIARVTTRAALHRASGDGRLLGQFAGMGAGGGETLVYLWHEGDDGSIEARAVYSEGAGSGEDAATGSACANLGGWWHARGERGLRRTVRQGDAVHRPSELHLEVDADGGIHVGGTVHELGKGVLVL